MDLSFFGAMLLLFIVLDPLGNIPIFISVLRIVPERRRLWVVLRESLAAFVILIAALLSGQWILDLLQISQTSLGIAGGTILLIIALRIIFPPAGGLFGDLPSGEPLIVPLAVPLIAGPSSCAIVLLLAAQAPERMGEWLLVIAGAVALSTVVLSCGLRLSRVLGERGLVAMERLMGLILTILAVDIFLDGVRDFINGL